VGLNIKNIATSPSIYAEIQPWAIFLKKIKLDHLSINDAKIQLFVDAKGYSNTSVFLAHQKPILRVQVRCH